MYAGRIITTGKSLRIWLLLASMVISSNGLHAEIEGRIVLEEVEVILLKDGKEVKRMKVSDEEALTIGNSVRKEVLGRLGVETVDEAIGKGLLERLSEEAGRLVRMKRISPPVLRFVDERGRTIRSMVMERPGKTGKAPGKRSSTAVKHGGTIGMDAAVSENGKYAAVTGYYAWRAGRDAPSYETMSTVSYYDAKGNLLWIREIPEDMYVNRMALSYDGGVIAFIQVHERGDHDLHPNLVILNREMEEILLFPGAGEKGIRIGSSFLKISPGGRFLAVSARFEDNNRSTLFFDLARGTIWKAPTNYVPLDVSDDGTARVRWYTKGEWRRETINFGKYLEQEGESIKRSKVSSPLR